MWIHQVPFVPASYLCRLVIRSGRLDCQEHCRIWQVSETGSLQLSAASSPSAAHLSLLVLVLDLQMLSLISAGFSSVCLDYQYLLQI